MSKAWMPLYIGDYLGDTAHLNQGQHGAYLLFLMHYWQRGSIPSIPEDYYQIAHAMDDQSRCNADAVLRQYFALRDGSYRQDRADRELTKAKSAFERRSGAAKRRWDKQSLCNASSKDVHSICNPCEYDSDSDLEVEVREIAKIYPRIADWMNLSPGYANTIAEAVARHGAKVLEGTRRFRECYDRWPRDQVGFASGVEKFFKTSEYLFETDYWERNDNGQTSKGAARSGRSKQNIFEGISADARRRVTPDEPERKGGAGAGAGLGIQPRAVGGTA